MKKFFKGVLILLLSLIILFTAFAFISGKTYLFKAVYYNYAGIDDYKIFDNNTVKVGRAQPWPVCGLYNKIKTSDSLSNLLYTLKTVALLCGKK